MTGAPGSSDADEVSPRELLRIIWRGKWTLLAGVLLAATIAFLAARFTPKQYEARVVLSPVSSDSEEGQLSGLSARLGSLGGLAALAGISAPGDSRSAESLAVLQSDALTRAYIESNDLLPILFPENWDPTGKRWRSSVPQQVPTLWQGNMKFERHRSVSIDPKTGLATLKITWNDPEMATQWANGLVKYANESLRTEAIKEAERSIEYLTAEAGRTEMTEVKQAIYTLLQTEFNKIMLAKGREEYALKVVDPAFRPESPYSPNTILWTLAGAILGLFASVLIVLMRGPSA